MSVNSKNNQIFLTKRAEMTEASRHFCSFSALFNKLRDNTDVFLSLKHKSVGKRLADYLTDNAIGVVCRVVGYRTKLPGIDLAVGKH